MRSRIVYTAGGMAVNAKHRRAADSAYWVGRDVPSQAACNGRCNLESIDDGFCPRHEAGEYAVYSKLAAKHRAEVSS